MLAFPIHIFTQASHIVSQLLDVTHYDARVIDPLTVIICPSTSNSRQAIIWSNDAKFTDAYMRRSASMS